MQTLTDFEKRYLKEAICDMIDEGHLYGRIDTIEAKEGKGPMYYEFIHKEWEILIKMINQKRNE